MFIPIKDICNLRASFIFVIKPILILRFSRCRYPQTQAPYKPTHPQAKGRGNEIWRDNGAAASTWWLLASPACVVVESWLGLKTWEAVPMLGQGANISSSSAAGVEGILRWPRASATLSSDGVSTMAGTKPAPLHPKDERPKAKSKAACKSSGCCSAARDATDGGIPTWISASKIAGGWLPSLNIPPKHEGKHDIVLAVATTLLSNTSPRRDGKNVVSQAFQNGQYFHYTQYKASMGRMPEEGLQKLTRHEEESRADKHNTLGQLVENEAALCTVTFACRSVVSPASATNPASWCAGWLGWSCSHPATLQHAVSGGPMMS